MHLPVWRVASYFQKRTESGHRVSSEWFVRHRLWNGNTNLRSHGGTPVGDHLAFELGGEVFPESKHHQQQHLRGHFSPWTNWFFRRSGQGTNVHEQANVGSCRCYDSKPQELASCCPSFERHKLSSDPVRKATPMDRPVKDTVHRKGNLAPATNFLRDDTGIPARNELGEAQEDKGCIQATFLCRSRLEHPEVGGDA